MNQQVRHQCAAHLQAIGSRNLKLRGCWLAVAAKAAETQRVHRDTREDAGPTSAGLWGDLGRTDLAVPSTAAG